MDDNGIAASKCFQSPGADKRVIASLISETPSSGSGFLACSVGESLLSSLIYIFIIFTPKEMFRTDTGAHTCEELMLK
jgi:hypothetical protein